MAIKLVGILKIAVAIICIVSNLIVVGCAGFFSFFVPAWGGVSDGEAFVMTSLDWFVWAHHALLVVIFFGAILTSVLFFVNKLIFVKFLKYKGFDVLLAALSFGIIYLAALIGSINFFLEKPYM